MHSVDNIPQRLLDDLASHARQADEESVWPAASWQIVEQIGALRWTVPKRSGGEELSGTALLARYEALAAACLTTCFILSQRDAACWRLHSYGDGVLGAELFPQLIDGKKLITVGLAQLTTSRQHTQPAVTARISDDDLIVDGVVPWVTGAAQANWILTGAVLENRQQVLFVLPTELPGVRIGPPLELAALQGSLTAEVRCAAVRVPGQWLLAGPAEHVLQSDRGAGSLQTSCLALGLTSRALGFLDEQACLRAEILPHAARLRQSHEQLRQRMYHLAGGDGSAEAVQSLRAEANSLVLRATQAALAVSKGTGFLRQHPVQRWARQALFFLVWSCPWPVTAATMDHLTLTIDN